ncbi:Fic family protein [Candidatus Margulisiibacteriota bacterium]
MPNWIPKFDPQVNTKDHQILEDIIEIEAYKRSTLKIPLPPGIRSKLNELNIIRAIKGTTGIEGNTLSEEEVESLVESKKIHSKTALQELEVLNAAKTFEFTKNFKKDAAETIITENQIKHLHKIITKGCNYKNNILGSYRKHVLKAGDFYPPKPEEIKSLMNNFIKFINSREVINGYKPIIRSIIAHFYLVSIHPFGDGNGRCSRALEAFILYHGGYNIVGFYSLSNFFYKNRRKYIEELMDARFKYNGNLINFIKFALGGYKQELESIQDEILFYVKERFFKDYIEELLSLNKINERISSMLINFINYKISMPEKIFRSRTDSLIKLLFEGVSERTFYRDLEIIEKLKLLKLTDGNISANIELIDSL